MGKLPTRDQELCDHCMAPLTNHIPALEYMKEILHECFKMGIPLKTRHQEVTPGQFEFASEHWEPFLAGAAETTFLVPTSMMASAVSSARQATSRGTAAACAASTAARLQPLPPHPGGGRQRDLGLLPLL